MAVHSQTIDYDQLNTLTERAVMPGVNDAIMRSRSFFRRRYNSGTKLDGGSVIQCNFRYGEGPGGAYDDGQALDTSEVDIVTGAIFQYKYYYASATIRHSDELKNRGKHQIGSIWDEKMSQMEETMKSQLGNALYGSSVVNALAVNGLADHVATTGTVGGISKSLNPWYQAKAVSMSGVPMSPYWLRYGLGLATEDEMTPDEMYCDQSVYNILYNLAEPQKRFMDVSEASIGFRNILVENRPVYIDSKGPAQTLYGLTGKTWDMVTHSDENMRFQGWERPFGRTSRTSFIFHAWNLICKNPRFNVVWTSVAS